MLDWLLSDSGFTAVIAFALVLIPAVIIHELGHFFAGKSVGITILEFGVGFPPRIGRLFTWRGTEFTLNWLPLGGFVRPLGEDMVSQKGAEAENLDRVEAKKRGIETVKSVNEARPLERILFFSAGAIANLISAFILFVIIGILGVAIGSSVLVASVAPDSPLSVAGIQPNDVIDTLNGETFLTGEALITALNTLDTGETAELLVRRGEAGEEVRLTYIAEETTAATSSSLVRIVGVIPTAPAGLAGVEAGDIVRTFNGQTVASVPQLIELTSANLGQAVELVLERDGETYEIVITPRLNPPAGEGSMGIEITGVLRDNQFGLTYQTIPNQVISQLGFGEAVRYSLDNFAGLFQSIINLPRMIFQGEITAEQARPVSIVGISQLGGYYLRESIQQERPVLILNYIAIISIALGLTNLLPLPALDGGRILFVLIEMVRGRPIPPEREGMVHLLGLVFLLSLTVVIIINDFINPISELIP
ncbi:MAG: RIP metalloprotease RseP [Phototrophicaceae bacterium]|jgi:regulator of sigma E protease